MCPHFPSFQGSLHIIASIGLFADSIERLAARHIRGAAVKAGYAVQAGYALQVGYALHSSHPVYPHCLVDAIEVFGPMTE